VNTLQLLPRLLVSVAILSMRNGGLYPAAATLFRGHNSHLSTEKTPTLPWEGAWMLPGRISAPDCYRPRPGQPAVTILDIPGAICTEIHTKETRTKWNTANWF